MSLELIREAIRVNQVIGEDLAQTVIENDIIVPDVKPDISRILLLDGDIFSYNAETSQDRVQINGTIQYKILYVSDDDERSIKSINASSNFLCNLDIPDTRSGMNSKVKCEIEHMDYEILNGRKINVKSIIRASGKVIDEIEQSVINGLSELEEVQVLKSNVKVNSSLGENSEEFSVKEALEVPSGKPTIREILRNDIKVIGKDYKITDNKIIAKGELNISTLYIGDDENASIQIMEHEVPFTHFIDLYGVNDNSTCDVDFQLTDVRFEAAEDSDGELRMLNGDIAIKVTASGFSKRNLEMLDDAYSRQVRLGIEKEPFRVEEIVAENKSQVILKDTITVQEGNPDISEVFNVLCKPSISDVKVQDDKVVVEGVVSNNILYLANDEENPVLCNSQEIPFKHSLDVKGVKPEMNCEAALDVEHCNYSMVSINEVEIRLDRKSVV